MPGFTYDFTDIAVRDLSELIADILQEDTLGFVNLFSQGPAPINVKHEWAQDSIQALAGTLNAAALVGDTNLVVTDSSVFKVNDIITAVTPAGVSSLERMRVTVIVDGTNITVVRGIGSAAAALIDQSELRIVARPVVENNKNFTPETTQPSTDYNYTEIYERNVELSRTMMQVRHYAMGGNPMAYQEMLRMRELMREWNRSLIWGVRDAGTKTLPRRMGGLLEFATKVPLNAVLDNPTQINDQVEAIVREGGRPSALVVNTDMARKISAFNSGTSLRTALSDRDAGSFVARFVGDTPISGIQSLVVDTDFPRDMVAIVDQSRLEINTLQPFVSINSEVNGQDGTSRVIRGELTSSWKNAATVHRVITGITL